ncbi:MAG: ribulose-phosphate 3-epimerase [Opitutaceae bacterium]|jgi:ribulose-phosphate 3-epimerase|nr:ribulose-phosphate 3-epimerase [Opitutaceae bacterium]
MNRRKLQLSPSMMCADFLHLEEEIRLLEKYGADWLHIDVMDGHYVPNFTLGIDYCRALAGATRLPFDVHLMVEHPEAHVGVFAALPGARLTFHPETVRQPVRLVERIRELGASPGIALDPGQPVQQFRHLLPMVDQVIVMTVNPGYAGQRLLPHCLSKITELKTWLAQESLPAEIEVDGNVSWQNIPAMVAAGGDILVAGTSSLFEKHRSREESFAGLRALLDKLEREIESNQAPVQAA